MRYSHKSVRQDSSDVTHPGERDYIDKPVMYVRRNKQERQGEMDCSELEQTVGWGLMCQKRYK